MAVDVQLLDFITGSFWRGPFRSLRNDTYLVDRRSFSRWWLALHRHKASQVHYLQDDRCGNPLSFKISRAWICITIKAVIVILPSLAVLDILLFAWKRERAVEARLTGTIRHETRASRLYLFTGILHIRDGMSMIPLRNYCIQYLQYGLAPCGRQEHRSWHTCEPFTGWKIPKRCRLMLCQNETSALK